MSTVTGLKITVNRAEFAAAVAFAGKALPRSPAAAVLAGMRLEVADGHLTVAAFDYDEARRVHVAGEFAESGVILVNGAQLSAVVKGMAKGKTVTAELEAGGNGLTLRCAGAVSQLAALPLDDYPALPPMPALSGTVDGTAFARSVARVAVAASRDDTLPVLTCVQLETGTGSLTLAATDRYRLATDELHWTPAGLDAESGRYLVPAAALTAFAKGCSGKVTVHFGTDPRTPAGHAGFSDGTREMIVHCMGGEYVRYSQILPGSCEASAVLDASALAGAVKRAGAMVERNMPVRLTFDGCTSVVTVTAVRDGAVASTEHVPAEFTGTPLDAGYNPAYLGSLLSGVDGTARLSFNGATKPVQVTSNSSKDAYRAICMPIQNAA
jgi:DNA polymerase-3 subunit beta